MHTKAKGRRLLAFVCVTACLIPVALTLYTTAGEWQQLTQWAANPMFIGVAVVTSLLVAGVVWWKAAASVPEVIIIPAISFFVCQSAGVFRHETRAEPAETRWLE